MKKFILVVIIAISVLVVSFTGCLAGRPNNTASSSSELQSTSGAGEISSENSSEEISNSESSSETISNSSSSSSSKSSSSSSSNSSASTSSSSSSSLSQVKEYVILFADEDGTHLKSIIVKEGGAVAYDGQEPSKENTAEYNYTFTGWTDGTTFYEKGEVLPVASDNVTYTAHFCQAVNEYTITWNIDGNVSTSTLKYGEMPKYDGTPTKTSGTEEFAFYAWTPSLTAVTGDATYTANFIEKDIEYSDFGAVGDGSTDDFFAIYKAHAYANATEANKVVAQNGSNYYICNVVPKNNAKIAEWAKGITNGKHTTSHDSTCKYGANKNHINENGLATDCHGNIVTPNFKNWVSINSYIFSRTYAVSIEIMTDTVWTGAKFVIDDREVASYILLKDNVVSWNSERQHSTDIFAVSAGTNVITEALTEEEYNSTLAETTTTDEFNEVIKENTYLSALNNQIQTSGIGPNTSKLNISTGYKATVIIYNESLLTTATRKIANESVEVGNQNVYIRRGIHANEGEAKRETVLIDENGNIHSSTPIMFDYTRIVRVEICRSDIPTLTISGGNFTTRASQIDIRFSLNSDGSIADYNGTTHTRGAYLYRGINVNRSNTVLNGVEHYVTDELSLSEYDGGSQGAHYYGFYNINNCSNVTLQNCVLTGRRYYGISGSYDFYANAVCGINLIDCKQSNFWIVENSDGTIKSATKDTENATLGVTKSTKNNNKIQVLWGVGASNWCKNMEYWRCSLARFDAHQGLYNGKVIDCTLNTISIVGKGEMVIENTEIICPDAIDVNCVVRLRHDYGSTWNGKIKMNNVTVTPDAKLETFSLIYFQYYNHYFGYDCYLPDLTVENLTITNTELPVYVFGSSGETAYYANSMGLTQLSDGSININKTQLPTRIQIDDLGKYNYILNYVADNKYWEDSLSQTVVPVTITLNHKTIEGSILEKQTVTVNYDEVYKIYPKNYSNYEPNLNYVQGCFKQDGVTEIDIYQSPISSAWDGTSASANLSGGGTEYNPYLISSGEDLKYIENQVESGNSFSGEYFKLAKSINLNFNNITIGFYNNSNSKSVFGGILDGNNCIIKNLSINCTSTTNTNERGSALFGAITGSVSNLTVYGMITTNADYSGIFGYIDTNATAINCVSFVTIKGNNNLGGIVGYSWGVLKNCVNYGTITGASSNVGGVVGRTGKEINNCINFGTVSASNVGGIVGTTTSNLVSCVNYGNIISNETAVGIVCQGKYEINNCVNYGIITAPRASGILGTGDSTTKIRVVYCKNFGEINSTNAGGIVLFVNYSAQIYYGGNYGRISGATKVGGIVSEVGETGATLDLATVVNYGSVVGSSATYLGGFVGYCADTNTVSIRYSHNMAEISGASYVGGIVGYLGMGAVIENCNNRGTIIGEESVGGIAGEQNGGEIKNCTNYGTSSEIN